jgi:hypothetical protein
LRDLAPPGRTNGFVSSRDGECGFVRRPDVVSRAAVVGFVRFARLRILRDQSLLEKKRKAEMPKSAKEIIELVARGVLFNSRNQRTMIAEVLGGRYSCD